MSEGFTAFCKASFVESSSPVSGHLCGGSCPFFGRIVLGILWRIRRELPFEFAAAFGVDHLVSWFGYLGSHGRCGVKELLRVVWK